MRVGDDGGLGEGEVWLRLGGGGVPGGGGGGAGASGAMIAPFLVPANLRLLVALPKAWAAALATAPLPPKPVPLRKYAPWGLGFRAGSGLGLLRWSSLACLCCCRRRSRLTSSRVWFTPFFNSPRARFFWFSRVTRC